MVDWYPTLLKLAGASLDQKLPLDGLDIWPTITAGKPSPHAEILLNAEPDGGAIRMGDWKLIIDAGSGAKKSGQRFELFNLAGDPNEKRNLAAEQPEKVQALRGRYAALAAEAAPPLNKPMKRGFKVPEIWGEPE
jgi:arylsulfatase A-like enzyme